MLLIRRPPCYRSLHVKVIGPTPDLKLIQRNHRCCIKCRWEFVAMTSIRGFVHWQMVDKKRWRNEGEPLDFPWCQIWCGILPQMERWAAQMALLGMGQDVTERGRTKHEQLWLVRWNEEKSELEHHQSLTFLGKANRTFDLKNAIRWCVAISTSPARLIEYQDWSKRGGDSKFGWWLNHWFNQWNQPGYIWSTGIR